MSKLAEIEALLFVAGEDGLRVRQIAELLSIPPTGVTQSLEKLAEKYQKDEDSSLALLETSNTYKIVTKQDFAELLREYSKAPINQSLSRAAFLCSTVFDTIISRIAAILSSAKNICSVRQRPIP